MARKTELINYAKRAVMFIIIMIVLDQLTGRTLKYFFFKHEPLVNINTRYVINKCDQDILIFGSSHAEQHYACDQITANTKMTCFNTGASAEGILYSYAMLQAVLARYSPKVILLDIRAEEFDETPERYGRLAVITPYYDEHPELRDMIYQRSEYERLKLLSATYKFNSELLSIISRNLHTNPDELKKPADNGFRTAKVTDTLSGPAPTGDNYYPIKKFDTNFANVFRSFLKDCKARNIKLFVFISPLYSHIKPDLKTEVIARQISRQYGVPFFNNANSAIFKLHPNYFHDNEHLNITGARIYTDTVIKQMLTKLNLPFNH